MAFTGNDIKALAESIVDDTLIEEDVIENINMALLEFAEVFRKTDTQEITVTDTDAWTDRTAGHLAVLKITSGGKDYTGKFELTYDRAKIKFPAVGTYTITSLIAPDAITSLDDTIEVHDLFKPGIAQFVGAYFKLKDNDQNPDGLRMESKALSMIRRASSLIAQGDRRQGQRVPIRR